MLNHELADIYNKTGSIRITAKISKCSQANISERLKRAGYIKKFVKADESEIQEREYFREIHDKKN